MKKLVAMLLAMIMALSFAACGNETIEKLEEEPAEENGNTVSEVNIPEGATALTLENYKKYLNFQIFCNTWGDSVHYKGNDGYGIKVVDGSSHVAWYEKFGAHIVVEGASQNFNYNDIVIECVVKGKYGSIDPNSDNWVLEYHDFEIPISIELNIAGYGENNNGITVYDEIDKQRTVDELIEYEFEIVSISGYVTNA